MALRAIVLVTAWITLACHCAYGELLVFEDFDYDVGSLDGTGGGTGFSDEWFVESLFPFEVDEPDEPLSYNIPGPGGGLISGGNRALHFFNDTEDEVLANEVAALQRTFDTSIDGDDVYFSFLYQYDDEGFIDDNDFVVWWFNDVGGPQVGLKGNGGNGSVPDDIVARIDSRFVEPHQVYAPEIDIFEEDEETFFIVTKISRAEESDDPDDYDEISLWVNPSMGDESDPLAVGIAFPEDALHVSLDSIGLRAFSQEPGDAMWWDALRIGTTWEDVVSPLGDGEELTGDFDNSGELDIGDIDLLAEQIQSANPDLSYDLDNDAEVAVSDLTVWVKDLRKTWIGDSNLDNEFNSSDLVEIFAAGKFESGEPATWAQGDWNADGSFDSGDLVAAFADGGFEQGPVGGNNLVPEPSSIAMLLPIGIVMVRRLRRARPKS